MRDLLRAVDARSVRLHNTIGFRVAREFFPGAPEWLLVTFPEHAPPPRKPSRQIDVRLVRSFEDMAKIFAVRSSTYLAEQFCLYDEEFDGNDFCASQFLGSVDGDPAGCIRLRYFGGFAKLERLAVRKEYRRTALAFELVRASLRHSRQKNFTQVYGHSRRDLLPFWGRFGFRPIEGRPVFKFANLEYIEVAAKSRGRPRGDPFRGRSDGGDPSGRGLGPARPARSFQSFTRSGACGAAALAHPHAGGALVGDGRRAAFSAADARQLQRTIEALTNTVDLLRARLARRTRATDAADAPSADLGRTVQLEIGNRALRASFFDPDFFCDPAWDMLLDLFLQQSMQKRVCVSSLCVASCAPSTTALRWIRALEDAGLVERSRDPADGRRIFIRLTAVGHAKIAGYLAAMACPGCARTSGDSSDVDAPD